MAEPNWTYVYNFGQTPEANGFTRILYGAPVVTEVTGGSPQNKRVEVNSDGGSCVFQTSNVPSLNEITGFTCECVVQSGSALGGNAGFEITFLGRQILCYVFHNRILVTMPSAELGEQAFDVPTDDNSVEPVRIRLTFANGATQIWRNGVSIINTAVPPNAYAFQRVLWWGEGGGVQVWRELKTYLGGAVAP